MGEQGVYAWVGALICGCGCVGVYVWVYVVMCMNMCLRHLHTPLWTDPGIQSGISTHELISTSNKKNKNKKAQAGKEWSNILPKSSQASKTPPPYECVGGWVGEGEV